jgi:transposase-like protein
LEDFDSRPFDVSERTETFPVRGSTDHMREVPSLAPRIAATTCGIVACTDEDPGCVRITRDEYSPTEDSGFSDMPTTAVGGRLYQLALNVGVQIGQSLKYGRASTIRQGIRQRLRRKRMTEAAERMSEADWWRSHSWTDQRTPALAIVARGDQIRTLDPATYSVRSQSHPEEAHTVSQEGGRWSCDCAFFSSARMTCIHILAVRFRNGLQENAPTHSVPAVVCESCRSTDVIRKGVRRNKSGDVMLYLCSTCGRRFAGREGFHNRRADPEKIALALDLYFRGMSVRKIQEHFRQVHQLKVSHVTVYRWVAHFGKIAAEWMDAQGARTSDRWHVDETVVGVNGINKYLWNVLDHETRFLLATHVSRGRNLKDTRAPLHKAKEATPDRPVDVLTDGMQTYPEAVSKELGRRATPFDDPRLVRRGWFSPHRRVPSIRAKESNNRIERFHGTEKERVKVMRGFDNDGGTSALMEGFRAHYNLVKDHQTLGMTPGEAAGIPTGDGFRWMTVLREATKTGKTRNVTPVEENSEDPKS